MTEDEILQEVESDPHTLRQRTKEILKGLQQLTEEGATQIFYPMISNDLILGAVGVLQFEVVAFRLQHEYDVECFYEPVSVETARWVESSDAKQLEDFKKYRQQDLALDNKGALVYLAPNHIYLTMSEERWPALKFFNIKEH